MASWMNGPPAEPLDVIELALGQPAAAGDLTQSVKVKTQPVAYAGGDEMGDLARAFNLNHQPENARNELIDAMEIAPGFRPAQKLLLQLSGSLGRAVGIGGRNHRGGRNAVR